MMAATLPLLGPLVVIDTDLALAVIAVAFNLALAALRLEGE
jgi:hypothetical protein